jgi:hypothetical protein
MLGALSRLSSRSLVASAVGAATLSAGSVAFTTGAAAGASQDTLKQQVGYKAIDDYVRSGMVVGLGTGSTAYFAGTWGVRAIERERESEKRQKRQKRQKRHRERACTSWCYRCLCMVIKCIDMT